MDKFEKEIKKLREEAARYRTQLAPYKKAFSNFEPDAVDWVLRTVELVQEDPSEAGKRFATLAYGNLGESDFKSWVEDIVYDGEVVGSQEEYDHNEDYEGEDIMEMPDMDGSGEAMPEWAKKLEERVTSVVEKVENQNQERAVMAERKEQFKVINSTVERLGYDADSWQGKMLLNVAANEIDANEDLSVRLEKADAIVRERIGDKAESAPAEPTGTVQIGNAEVPQEVPATGGQVGGGGIPDVTGETPITFGDADEALMTLMKTQVGQ